MIGALVALLVAAQAPDAGAPPAPPSPEQPPAASPPAAPPPDPRPAVYVVDPKMVNMASAVAATVSGLVAKTAESEGLRAFTRDDAKVLLEQAADLQTLGADADGASLSALGKAVGARHVLATVVSSVDDDTLVQLRLIDVEQSKVLSRRELHARDFDGALTKTVEAATRLALAPLFAGKKGTLDIVVSEDGADILVDDAIVATTPLEAPLSLASGMHLIAVEKQGFVRQARDVRVREGEQDLLDFTLRPSADFLEEYTARADLFRTLAWVSTGAGLVSTLATGGMLAGFVAASQNVTVVDQRWRDKRADDPGFDEADAEQANLEVSEARYAANLWGVGVVAAAGALLVTGGLATFFWIFGDDPARYDHLSAE